MRGLRIGDLAERTGTSAPTIRYYESIGRVRRAPRQSGNQRVYSRQDVERLTFIRRCREFDFSIEHVRVRELEALERSLVSFVEACDSSCAGGPGPECVILGNLGKHCGCGSARL